MLDFDFDFSYPSMDFDCLLFCCFVVCCFMPQEWSEKIRLPCRRKIHVIVEILSYGSKHEILVLAYLCTATLEM